MAALQPQALLVVTDTTQGMAFGIDAHVWTLGAKFEGLHSISEGLHLLTFAPGGVAGREGVFIDCVGGGVHRQRWDVQNECLGSCSLNDAQSESLEAAASSAEAARCSNQLRRLRGSQFAYYTSFSNNFSIGYAFSIICHVF